MSEQNSNPLRVQLRRWPLVNYHHDDGMVWADSPEFPRWIAAGDTFDECAELVAGAREALFRSDGWPRP